MLNITKFKGENFKFNWKEFFSTDKSICKNSAFYKVKNPVMAKEFTEWCKQTIWYGRHKNKQKILLNDICFTKIANAFTT